MRYDSYIRFQNGNKIIPKDEVLSDAMITTRFENTPNAIVWRSDQNPIVIDLDVEDLFYEMSAFMQPWEKDVVLGNGIVALKYTFENKVEELCAKGDSLFLDAFRTAIYSFIIIPFQDACCADVPGYCSSMAG